MKIMIHFSPPPPPHMHMSLRTGGRHGAVVRCRKCQGSGIQVSHRPIGPGMVQQIQSACGDCGGTGDFIREKDRCKKCKGKRVLEVDEKLEVWTYSVWS